ncbi:hypothetical protein ACFYTQ_18520 [Nocardia sp. NPDC004068]|uniref:hypothetical protein n=1 Tax=Nocardia sp. NPDC004068 TaxID=3364303 RepID=UPI0036938F59
MGEYRPHTAAELARMEQDQHDPKWLAWVAPELMETQLRKFLTDTVPDMPDDPWTAEGLAQAECVALELFPTMQATRSPENRDVADQFHRFIGEVFRRNFEGSWYNVPSFDDSQGTHGFGPVIKLPFAEFYFTVIQQLTTVIDRHTGKQWAWIYAQQQKNYDDWKNSGRLPLSEWQALKQAR